MRNAVTAKRFMVSRDFTRKAEKRCHRRIAGSGTLIKSGQPTY